LHASVQQFVLVAKVDRRLRAQDHIGSQHQDAWDQRASHAERLISNGLVKRTYPIIHGNMTTSPESSGHR
jgi:hypothetical protein